MHTNEERVKERLFYPHHIIGGRMSGILPLVVYVQKPRTFIMGKAFIMCMHH